MNWTGGKRARNNGHRGLNYTPRVQKEKFAKIRMAMGSASFSMATRRSHSNNHRSSSPQIAERVDVPWSKSKKPRFEGFASDVDFLSKVLKRKRAEEEAVMVQRSRHVAKKINEESLTEGDSKAGENKKQEIDLKSKKRLLLQQDDWLGKVNGDSEDVDYYPEVQENRHKSEGYKAPYIRVPVGNDAILLDEEHESTEDRLEPKLSHQRRGAFGKSHQPCHIQRRYNEKDDESSLLLEVGNTCYTTARKNPITNVPHSDAYPELFGLGGESYPVEPDRISSDSMLLDYEHDLFLPVCLPVQGKVEGVEEIEEEDVLKGLQDSDETFFTWSSSSYAGKHHAAKPTSTIDTEADLNVDGGEICLDSSPSFPQTYQYCSLATPTSPAVSEKENSNQYTSQPIIRHKENMGELGNSVQHHAFHYNPMNSSLIAYAASAEEDTCNEYPMMPPSDLNWMDDILGSLCQKPSADATLPLREEAFEDNQVDMSPLMRSQETVTPNDLQAKAKCDDGNETDNDCDWLWGRLPKFKENEGRESESKRGSTESMTLSSDAPKKPKELEPIPSPPLLQSSILGQQKDPSHMEGVITSPPAPASNVPITPPVKANCTIITPNSRKEFGECYGFGVAIDLQIGEEQAWTNFVYTTTSMVGSPAEHSGERSGELHPLSARIVKPEIRKRRTFTFLDEEEHEELLTPVDFSAFEVSSMGYIGMDHNAIYGSNISSKATTETSRHFRVSSSPQLEVESDQRASNPDSSLAGNASSFYFAAISSIEPFSTPARTVSSPTAGASNIRFSEHGPAGFNFAILSSSATIPFSENGPPGLNTVPTDTETAEVPLSPPVFLPPVKFNSAMRGKTTHGTKSESSKKVMWAQRIQERGDITRPPIQEDIRKNGRRGKTGAGEGPKAEVQRVRAGRSLTQIKEVFVDNVKAKAAASLPFRKESQVMDEIEDW